MIFLKPGPDFKLTHRTKLGLNNLTRFIGRKRWKNFPANTYYFITDLQKSKSWRCIIEFLYFTIFCRKTILLTPIWNNKLEERSTNNMLQATNTKQNIREESQLTQGRSWNYIIERAKNISSWRPRFKPAIGI